MTTLSMGEHFFPDWAFSYGRKPCRSLSTQPVAEKANGVITKRVQDFRV